MFGRLVKLALLLMVLTLAGCFRPADEGIEPTSNEAQPPAVPTNTPQRPTRLPASEDTEQANSSNNPPRNETEEPSEVQPGGNGSGSGETATFPPITVIPPTRSTEPPATNDAGINTGSTALPAESPTFITPGSPLLPVATDTPRGTPTGGAFTSTPSGLITPTDFLTQDDECIYTVQPGDSLFRIATDRGLTVEDVQAVNPDLSGSAPIIYPGDQITIPNCGTDSSDGGNVSAETPEPTTVSAPPGGQVYEVQPGDTLVRIAEEFGVTVEDIVAVNNLDDPDRLDVGQQLVIPPSGG